MNNGPDERGIASYVKRVIHKGPVDRRLFPWFKGTVTEVLTSGFSMMVRIKRSGEFFPDGGTYAVATPNYRPQVGDTVDLLWRDDDTAYAMVPRGGVGGFAPWSGWLHWQHYVVGAGGAVDTSSNPGGDLTLPVGYNHAWVVVSNATDTGVGTSANFGGLQVAISGGTIVTAADYVWTDKDVFTNTGGATSEGITGSPNGQDAAWGPFVLTGGGTGSNWPSSANIYLPGYSQPNNHATAFWDILQINNSTIVRRMGAGYFAGSAGVVTKLHFFARVNHMAAGTTFDLFVAS